MAEAVNGDSVQPTRPLQLSFALPTSPDTRVHLQLTVFSHSLLLFLAMSGTAAPASLSSFVYALPNQLQPTAQPLSTPLYVSTNTVDFMTRLAKIVARKANRPAYVGGDVKFWTGDDESVAMKGVVDVVQKALTKLA